MKRTYIIAAIVAAIIFIVISTTRTVDTKCVGVITLFGEVTGQEEEEGLHLFENPFCKYHDMPVSIQTFTTNMSAFSTENQDVICSVNAIYRIKPENATKVYKELRDNSERWETFISPLVSNAFKSITTEYQITSIVNKREELRERVFAKVQDRLAEQDDLFSLVRIEIVNMDYGKKYKDQIEERNKMTQQALQAEEQLKKEKMLAQIPVIQAQAKITAATAEAEARVIKAKADAEAYRIISAAVSMENIWLETIEKWNGYLPFTGWLITK